MPARLKAPAPAPGRMLPAMLHCPAPTRSMRLLAGALALAATALAVPQARASQSMRCNGELVGKGESPLVLLHKCGEPVYRQPVCVPMLQLGWIVLPYRLDGPGAVLANQCVPMEEWTYDRGPGNFLGVVRLYNGAIESVRDGARLR
ncbi:hypothetical protein GCM10007320_50160 [Pseudorhodoferax aquiterrae]|uniref:DUF2845 domain-containing protein n=2 Tax=Pseudorhodoferax aquiterrae TaxID=747304 RepID=A0ABQ3GAD6_9BURK|nr:hypothetical protein GCM10007320_50160 [Pseudorhodoferax aquiterrae]